MTRLSEWNSVFTCPAGSEPEGNASKREMQWTQVLTLCYVSEPDEQFKQGHFITRINRIPRTILIRCNTFWGTLDCASLTKIMPQAPYQWRFKTNEHDLKRLFGRRQRHPSTRIRGVQREYINELPEASADIVLQTLYYYRRQVVRVTAQLLISVSLIPYIYIYI